jgi:hypothetical protein
MLGTTKRKDGKLQVTYNGHPLYFFAPDKKAGDIKGQGFVHFGGTWWTVSAAGAKVTTKPLMVARCCRRWARRQHRDAPRAA